MKKYTHHRVFLFIGLLSLNTLSACVNTRQELGWCPNRGWIIKGVTALAAGTAGVCSLLYFVNRPGKLEPSINNGSSLTTRVPVISTSEHTSITSLYNDMPTEQVASIINATQRDPAHLVSDGALYDGLVLDPTFLNTQSLNDLEKNNFSIKSIKYWRQKNLNIDAKDKQGNTLLLICAKSYSNGNSHEEVLQFIIDNGANVNAQDKQGNTALHLVVERDHPDFANLLLKAKNIDVNAKNNDDRTPLHMAVLRSGLDIIDLLLKINNIDVNIRDKDGRTPLTLAICLGRVAAAQCLLQAVDINLNVIDNDNRTALHVAAQRGYPHLSGQILDHKNNNVNAKDKDGHTPLHLAAGRGSTTVVRRLLQAENVDVNAKNNRKRTPLHVAARGGYSDVVEVLVQQSNVSINEKDENGDTPLHLAAKGDH